MSGVNKVMLVGRLGKDPETMKTGAGKEFCKFSIATSKRFKGRDGEASEKTTWHNVVVWNEHTARYIGQYAVTGSMVYVEGEIENRSYEKDGVTKYITEIVVPAFGGNAQILSDGAGRGDNEGKAKSNGNSNEYAKQSGGMTAQQHQDLDDEIPF